MDAATRRLVRERANACCEYCRIPWQFSRFSLHVEHIVATKHGGDDTLDNLALACIDCNLRKGSNLTGIDPLTGEITVLFHPRKHCWSEHFVREDELVVGRTPIGRTTIVVLGMNADELMEFRKLVPYWET